jgi:hypothetical protein
MTGMQLWPLLSLLPPLLLLRDSAPDAVLLKPRRCPATTSAAFVMMCLLHTTPDM